MWSEIENRLSGKTVLITGASSGIGRSTAFAFARASPHDLKLILVARRIDLLEQVAQEISQNVGRSVQILCKELDIRNPEQIKHLMQSIPVEFQDINILVNNAGLVKGVARAPDIALDDISTMMETNVIGLIHMTQAVLPVFRKRPNGGSGDIINVGSISGRMPYAGGSIYCATKAAVSTFTESLRRELAPTRIRVMEVSPGSVETEFSLVRFAGDTARAAEVYKQYEPLTPEDVAEIIVFNASRRENVLVADTVIFPTHQIQTGGM